MILGFVFTYQTEKNRADLIYLARKTGDVSVCYKIKDSNPNTSFNRFHCINFVAAETKNEALCEEILDSYLQKQCYAEVGIAKKDPGLCERAEGHYYYAICYQVVAEEKKDPELCKKINDLKGFSSCVRAVAVVNKDISICEMIGHAYSQEECKRQFNELIDSRFNE